MEILKKTENNILTVALTGRLDTTTAPELEAALDYSGLEGLVFDFSALDYISSAGLRVLLSSQKAMAAKGGVTVKHSNPSILEVFEMTGFDSVLNIEK